MESSAGHHHVDCSAPLAEYRTRRAGLRRLSLARRASHRRPTTPKGGGMYAKSFMVLGGMVLEKICKSY